ncbi:MAG: hypothetical protein RL391_502 [Actinomycetota bacterium]|jgi:hypothetical protein
MLFAKNSDRPKGECQEFEWVRPRREASTQCTYISVPGHTAETLGCWISRPTWGWGAEHGVNEHGVAVGNATIYTITDPRPFPDALTGMDIVRLVLERSGNAATAVETLFDLISRHGQGGSGSAPGLPRRPYWSSFLIADGGSSFVIETDAAEVVVEEVSDAAAVSNRVTLGSMLPRAHPDQKIEHFVEPRLKATRHLLSTGRVTVDLVKEHLRSHDQTSSGWDVCMHNDHQETAASMIVEWLPGEVVVWSTQGSPCINDYVRRTVIVR